MISIFAINQIQIWEANLKINSLLKNMNMQLMEIQVMSWHSVVVEIFIFVINQIQILRVTVNLVVRMIYQMDTHVVEIQKIFWQEIIIFSLKLHRRYWRNIYIKNKNKLFKAAILLASCFFRECETATLTILIKQLHLN
jgi:hypothetical protein